jgi:anthranilate synthase component 1
MIAPSRDDFRALAREHTVVPVWREVVADLITPVAAFSRLCRAGEPGFLLESVEHAERWSRWSFVGRRAAASVVARGTHLNVVGELAEGIRLDEGLLVALEDLLARYRSPRLADLPPLHGGLVGYLGYDVVREVEHLPDVPYDDQGHPDAMLSVIGDLAAFDHYRQRVTLISNAYLFDADDEAEIDRRYDEAVERVERMASDISAPRPEPIVDPPVPGDELPEVKSSMGGDSYCQAVEVAREHIHAGDIFQVVLSQRFDFELDADPFDVYRVLRQVNPSPYMYLLRAPGIALVGSSPEPMVQLLDGKVISRPIAGTRRRGRTDDEDRRLGAELVEHPKEIAEHVMLVDLARNDVGRVVTFGTEKVDEMMTLERYSHVMHLTSQVSGELAEGRTPIDVLRATLPAGTVSGAPKVRAMEIIDALEPVKRGPYAGVVGYLDFSGNIDTAIAIRTMVVGADGRASVQAGAGIVADSVPEHEDLECRNKAEALLSAVPAARRMTAARRTLLRLTRAYDDPDRALWESVAAAPFASAQLSVLGEDAHTYLQGQLTQDVLGIEVNGSRWSLLLEPDGHVVALVRLMRVGDVIGIDVAPDQVDTVVERLERFLLRVDVTIAPPPEGMRAFAVRGPDLGIHPPFQGPGMALEIAWPGIEGFDVVGMGAEPPANLPIATHHALDALRIESGWPLSGVDIGPGDVPADLPAHVFEAAVSFEKGCYTGQELVERMHSRGAAGVRPLRGLLFSPGAPTPPRDAEVIIDGTPQGVVTSSSFSPARAAPVALARIPRKVAVPAAALVRWSGAETAARVIDLPFPLVASRSPAVGQLSQLVVG